MGWLILHWEDILVAVLAVDVFLISIFPATPIFVKIKDAIKGVLPGK